MGTYVLPKSEIVASRLLTPRAPGIASPLAS
jgi:hypothetical protein